MTDPVFSDEDLSRFLDGEVSDALEQDIRAALTRDAALSNRLDNLRSAQAAFDQTQKDLLSLAPKLPDLPNANVTSRSWSPAICGLAAGLAIAACISWASLSNSEPDWRDVVANYQSLYVTETLSGVTEPRSVSEAKLKELSDRLGLDLTNLPEVDGLAYRRAQQLGYKGTTLAQLTFLTHDGGPVALCLLRTDEPDSTAITAETLEGMAAFSWVDDGFGILLIGPLESPILPEAAHLFRTALRGAQT